MKKSILMLFLFVLTFSFLGCNTTNDSNGKIKIAVSIVPEASFVEAVASDLVEVITIIPPGFSPANYEPSAKTMANLAEASIYFTIGVPAEATTILPNTGSLYTVHLENVVNAIYPDRMFSEESRDPHIWLSIKRVKVIVQTIADELKLIDPDNALVYQTNANAYITQLDNVDQSISELFADTQMNKFIVFHPSYGYFADEYNLEMISLEEDGKEATPQHLQEVIDLAETYQIHTVFYQAEIDSSQVQAFAEEINATMIMLDPLSSFYIDNILSMAIQIASSLS